MFDFDNLFRYFEIYVGALLQATIAKWTKALLLLKFRAKSFGLKAKKRRPKNSSKRCNRIYDVQ